MEDEFKPSVQTQRWVNPNIKDVVKKEVINLFGARLIYPIFDNPCLTPVQVILKKGRITVVKNEKDELIPQRMTTGWRETDTQEKDTNKAKNEKTKHGMEKIEKDKVIRSRKSKVKARGQQKSTSGKSKSTPGKSKSNPTKPQQKKQRKYNLRD
nr:reverse transcriptase domain-containing protein [Tanacetum cinerariifolium]